MNRNDRSRHRATSPAIQIGTSGGPSMMIRNGHITMCTDALLLSASARPIASSGKPFATW